MRSKAKKRPIRIAYIDSGYRGEFEGGGQISLLLLVQWLPKDIIYPSLIYFSWNRSNPKKGDFLQAASELFQDIILLSVERSKGLSLWEFFKNFFIFYKFIRYKHIDLIHSNAGAGRETISGLIAAKLLGIPFVWHVRVIESRKWLDRFLFKGCNRIITISKAVAERFKKINKGSGKLEIIPNGVDLKQFYPFLPIGSLRKKYRIKDNALLIGVVGQLIPWKRQEDLVEAAQIVLQELDNIYFFIIGDVVGNLTWYREKITTIVQRNHLSDRIFITGFLEDMPEIINELDIVVSTSNVEPFGRTLIEAMACMKPVIATKAGGATEIVEDGITGILIPPKDPNILAEAILRLAQNNEERNRMGQAGCERVKKYFSIEKHVQKIKRLYSDLLKNNTY